MRRLTVSIGKRCLALGCIAFLSACSIVPSTPLPRNEGTVEREREFVERTESMRAAHRASESWLRELEELRCERQKDFERLEALEAQLENAGRRTEAFERERNRLARALDQSEVHYERLRRSSDYLEQVAADYENDLQELERDHYEFRESVARGDGSPMLPVLVGSDTQHLSADLARQLERVRAVEERILAQATDSAGPQRFDAHATPARKADAWGELFQLYRDDPGGLWREVTGFIGERFGSLFRGGARWDRYDTSLFGVAIAVVAILIWLIGSPLRWLLRQGAKRELEFLRRRVKELEATREAGAQVSAQLFLRGRQPRSEPGGEGELEPEEQRESIPDQLSDALDRALPGEAIDAALTESTSESGPTEAVPAGADEAPVGDATEERSPSSDEPNRESAVSDADLLASAAIASAALPGDDTREPQETPIVLVPDDEAPAPVFRRPEPPADPPNDETNLNPTQVFDAAAVHADLPAVSRPSESSESSSAAGDVEKPTETFETPDEISAPSSAPVLKSKPSPEENAEVNDETNLNPTQVFDATSEVPGLSISRPSETETPPSDETSLTPTQVFESQREITDRTSQASAKSREAKPSKDEAAAEGEDSTVNEETNLNPTQVFEGDGSR